MKVPQSGLSEAINGNDKKFFRMSRIYEKEPTMSTLKIPWMITDSNQACMAAMTGRRVQEKVLVPPESN